MDEKRIKADKRGQHSNAARWVSLLEYLNYDINTVMKEK